MTSPITSPIRGTRRAITLVELLIVLAIIAIVSGIVVPNMRTNVRGVRLRQAAGVLAENIRFAQMLAIDKEKPSRVRFDRQRGEYSVELAAELTGLEFVPAGIGGAGPLKLPEGIRFEQLEFSLSADGKKDLLWFWPAGEWSAGRVCLTDGERRFVVEVGDSLGQVEVREVEGAAPPALEARAG